MKNNDIWEALSHVREEYVEEASSEAILAEQRATARKKRIRNRLVGWGSLAACLALLMGVTYPLWNGLFIGDEINIAQEDDPYAKYPPRLEYDFVEMYPCIAVLPTFPYAIDGAQHIFSYPSIVWEGRELFVATNNRDKNYLISAELVGDAIGQLEAPCYELSQGTTVDIHFTLHRIHGIDPRVAVAAIHEGGEQYAVYRSHPLPEVDSWSELVQITDLQTHLTTRQYIFHTVQNKKGEDVRLVFDGMTAEILWDYLLSHGELVDYQGTDGNYLQVSVNHTLLNAASTLCVTKDGYVTFSMLLPGKALYVGADRVKTLVDYLEEHLTGYRLVDQLEQSGSVGTGAAETGVAETVTHIYTSAAPPPPAPMPE